MRNIDQQTVEGFGNEWSRFDQAALNAEEAQRLFRLYFRMFPWRELSPDAVGFDLGCGSGRWAKLVAPRVKTLHCVDPSEAALAVARRNLTDVPNAILHRAGVSEIPLADSSMDFGYSLGVLHHVPDTAAGLRSCVQKLKPGAPFLLYLYYAFDNRPPWFRVLWRISDVGRRIISQLPARLRGWTTDAIALSVYYPLARSAMVLERAGMSVDSFPLSGYRNSSFYTMRTDALDRFGTRLEQRFTRAQVAQMMSQAGLTDITVGDDFPFWCAVGRRRDAA